MSLKKENLNIKQIKQELFMLILVNLILLMKQLIENLTALYQVN